MVGLLYQFMHRRTESSQKCRARYICLKVKTLSWCLERNTAGYPSSAWKVRAGNKKNLLLRTKAGNAIRQVEGLKFQLPISLQVTGAGWTCYSLSRNVIINSQTGCSSLATVLHKSELRCGPLATEINKWLNVSGTKQVMERAKHYTLSCWGIKLA